MAYYLILDQGGQSTRALVFDQQGEMVAEARAPIATLRTEGGFVEQPIVELQQSLQTVLAEIAKSLADEVENICSAGLVTQRSSLVCWNRRTGEALTDVISWQDVRAKSQPQLLSLDVEQVAKMTGLRPSPHYGASKIRWCLDNLSRVREAHENGELVCGPLASYVLFFLTDGRSLAADPANGSRTLLWNCDSGQWDASLMAHFNIDETTLPPLQPIASHFGDLAVGGHRLPIRLMNGDQCAAFFGRGDLQPGVVAVNAGTGAFIATSWSENQHAPEGLLKTLVFDDGNKRQFVAEGTVNGAASALSWVAGSLTGKLLQQLEGWSGQIPEPPLFLNGVGGLGAPYWVPDFESAFIAAESAEPAGLPEKMIAVLESIIFLLMENLQRLQRGRDCQRIVVGGGLAASGAFCQKLASLSGLPVFYPDETELTARGAAFLLAGKPEGWEQSEGKSYQPLSDRPLQRRYRAWQKALGKKLARLANP